MVTGGRYNEGHMWVTTMGVITFTFSCFICTKMVKCFYRVSHQCYGN